MALVATSFLKLIPVLPNMGVSSGFYHDGLTPLPVDATTGVYRKLVNRVEDLTTVAVYYNGELIENSTDNPTGKYYYSMLQTLIPSQADMTSTWIPGNTVPSDTSDIVFSIIPNPAYAAPGYASGTSAVAISASDNFTISYYHVIYTVA